MTIKEYNIRKPIVEKINDIDEILKSFDYEIGDEHLLNVGIGIVRSYAFSYRPIYHIVNDKVLIDRFKQLLLERKQELINEFEK